MYELRPPALDERGLDAALRDYVDNVARETGLTCGFEWHVEDRLPPALETILFRVAQEALTNVAKHAKAHEVTLTVRAVDANVELEVCDDGIGFDPKQARAMAGANHFGLIGMRERMASAGGSFNLRSQPGGGSRIHAVLPREMSQR
jgi:signal transduction histidine kinase